MKVFAYLAVLAGSLWATTGHGQTADIGRSTSESGVLIVHSGSVFLGAIDLNNGTWRTARGEVKSLWEMAGYPADNSTGKNVGQTIGAKVKPCAGTDCDCENCAGPSCKCKPTLYGQSPPNNRDNGPPASYPGGVDKTRVRCDREHFTTSNGNEISRAEALSAVEAAGEIPNDSTSVRFTVIGPVAAREAVLKDLSERSEFSAFKGKFVLASYPSDHWRIRDGGFKTATNASDVMIYVQRPDGTVIWRQEGYAGGPSKLASALRDKVPGYDPVKDPNPENQPVVRPIEPGNKKPSALAWLIAGSVLLGGVWFASRKKG